MEQVSYQNAWAIVIAAVEYAYDKHRLLILGSVEKLDDGYWMYFFCPRSVMQVRQKMIFSLLEDDDTVAAVKAIMIPRMMNMFAKQTDADNRYILQTDWKELPKEL